MTLGKRRTALMAAGLAALLSFTAACGSSGPSGAAGGATAWALTGGDEQTMRTSFQQAKIDGQFFGNDAYKQKIRSAVGAGQAPTLLFSWGNGGMLKSWVDAGKVMDLTPEVQKDPTLTSRYLPTVAQTGVIDGKTYGVPNNGMQPVMVFYNKDLFNRIGAQPPKTWDDLMALVPRFNQAGIAPFALGGQSKWPLLMWEEYLVDRLGGPGVFDAIAANKPNAWSDPAVIQANSMIQQLVSADGFVKGFNSIATDSNADSALLYTGKAAMYLMGSWAFPSIKQADPDFISSGKLGWVTFPTVSGGKGAPEDIVGNPANFWSVSATATDQQKQAAIDYLRTGVMNDSYVDSLLASGSVPPVNGIESKLATTQDPQYLSYVYGLASKAPNFQLSWDQALSPGQADTLLNNLGQLFLRQLTPEQFSANMNATIGK
ncbi:raffinose/stachyose/melibiose transport system substrate-binding protein [Amycolatopsis bartoniae]|uniref:Sugar ABC transporter substrate-binding protein n=1 Tax=Amycolatopsis bartoniae TaxID=941986 RepID=A0A8H9M8L3_9PSEU|nr:extracellular solute-binding protein [Amycolatopsis bartoniae]MBB2934114.1 raffinose/stachyose/melibiose transport system substrate-binding protein [Amycolatopsis bartoniae]TVT05497.1 extracellular solute-binding protein [Amycolatopsis bartoniae]GHF84253.1 sugar ABC transporter substrate-binding protein [Amycolatopsis bartoniae]